MTLRKSPRTAVALAALPAFALMASTSCNSSGGSTPNSQSGNDDVIEFHGPLQLRADLDINGDAFLDDGFVVLNSGSTPDWVTPPADAGFKTALLFAFTHGVDEDTLALGHTFELTLNGAVAEGEWQFSPPLPPLFEANLFAAFYPNKTTGEIVPTPISAGDNILVSIRMKGTDGPITDTNGNVLPFNGVYQISKTNTDALAPLATPFKTEDLLDGDRDGVPGGDYVRDFKIIG